MVRARRIARKGLVALLACLAVVLLPSQVWALDATTDSVTVFMAPDQFVHASLVEEQFLLLMFVASFGVLLGTANLVRGWRRG